MPRACLVLTALLAMLLASPAALAAPEQRGNDVLQINHLWTLHLHLSARGWQLIQPTRTSRLAYLLGVRREQLPSTRPTTAPAVIDEEGRRMPPCPFGYEYAYIRAVADFDGRHFGEVGLRFKGNGSFASSTWLRRPLKLDFNRFLEGQEFDGLTSLNLHHNNVDPSQIREALSFLVYRNAGVPAPRTTFANVYLTIDGQCDRQHIGLYTLIEEVDKHFLKDHFGTSKGLLLKPEGVRNLAYLGEDWSEYGRYRPKTDVPERLARRFIDFTRFLHYADDETFASEIHCYLDVDEFLRFLAITTLLSNMDSFLNGNHNYYLYLHPEDGRIRFIPWDMHLSVGGSATLRNPDAAVRLSITQPHRSPNRLIERILSVGEYREAFDAYIAQYTRTCLSPESLFKEIDLMQQIVERADAEGAGPGATTRPTIPARPVRPMPEIKPFITARIASVMGQLDGTQEGYVPGERMPMPPPPLPPPPKIVLPPPPRKAARRNANVARPDPAERRANAAAMRNMTPAERRLARLEAAAQKAAPAAAAATQPPARTKPQPAARPAAPIPPRALAPNAYAAFLVTSLDDDRDGTLSLSELYSALCVFYFAAGATSADTLDEDTIARTLERLGNLLDLSRIAPPPGTPVAESPTTRQWAKTLLKTADANHDGRLSLQEASIAIQVWFPPADANGDRLLAPRELAEAMDRLVPR